MSATCMNSERQCNAEFDAAVNMARQSLYRFAALSLLDPKAGAWPTLQQLLVDPVLHGAAALLRTLPATRSVALARGERPLQLLDPRLVLERLPESPEQFNSEYEHTFGLLVSGACPPYETEYVDSKFVYQRSNGLADIHGYYHAFGLTISNQYPERADHVVLELEFMAHLLKLERDAGDESVDARERRQICRDAQVSFLTDHLTWWAPAFAKLLGRENPHGYYAATGIFLAALVAAERAFMQLPLPSDGVRPSVGDARELCNGCQFAE